ncbi:DUF5825 family protein [Actinomadura rubrisoli]|uniref:Uncharacterized protein n=1 Tax=Actinomadura rubrisoli TaxID=2530368 RepID=A0A4R4ZXK0_9ACTN|nr:DUF5825 family protein [Actinomadura rubrisoli]TDD63705.1 hypothetical protein E1298_43355 [Actinomadura rubrisoli]
MTPVTVTPAAPVAVTLWRDYEELDRPGVFAGSAVVSVPAAEAGRALFEDGVRRIALVDAVDLASAGGQAAAVRAFVLVRELTGYGIVVDWRLRLGAERWRPLSHLYPPGEVIGDEDARLQWRNGYHFFKCAYRRGPGFLQVRDRRSDVLRKITVDGAAHRAAIDDLLEGCPASAVDPPILRDLTTMRLVQLLGDMAWWLPYRARQWPAGKSAL